MVCFESCVRGSRKVHSYPLSPLQLCDTSISVVSPGIAWSLLWRTECWSHSLWSVAPVLPKHIHFLGCGCSLHVLLFCGMLIQTQSESLPVPGAPPLQGMHIVWWAGWKIWRTGIRVFHHIASWLIRNVTSSFCPPTPTPPPAWDSAVPHSLSPSSSQWAAFYPCPGPAHMGHFSYLPTPT